jgi:rhodanese-related sulfurtransferase
MPPDEEDRMNEIQPEELSRRLNSGEAIRLIDVRTPAEFREVHVAGAENIPLDRLDVKAFSHQTSNAPLYVICKSGARGKQACAQLSAAGMAAMNVEGGTLACESAGLALVRGRKTISLERQVRIVAGGISLTGALLALFVHPYFAGISAFIGGGLVFAGVTDWCGMAMLLAKMPWNR